MTHDMVSVVIPTHNRAEFLGAAIRSALGQSNVEVEVIVVDDASTDSTNEVLEGFGDQIRVLRLDKNVERGAARNLGVALAKGKTVAFLDSDDVWMPGKLAAQLCLVGDGEPVVTGIEYVDREGRPTGRRYSPPRSAPRQVFVKNQYLGSPSSLLVGKEVFLASGGFPEDRRLQGSEDWLLLQLLAQAGHEMRVVDRPFTRRRIHGDNDTGSAAAVERARWAAVEWMERQGIVNSAGADRARAIAATVIGRMYAAEGNLPEALSWVRRAFHYGGMRQGISAVMLSLLSGAAAYLRPRHR